MLPGFHPGCVNHGICALRVDSWPRNAVGEQWQPGYYLRTLGPVSLPSERVQVVPEEEEHGDVFEDTYASGCISIAQSRIQGMVRGSWTG
jgi:hypothetical protein